MHVLKTHLYMNTSSYLHWASLKLLYYGLISEAPLDLRTNLTTVGRCVESMGTADLAHGTITSMQC
uniref:Uncharacterized protein n=1 Tax=Anguilla anguilla TaxID=7936 RepID=A0A0E9PR41_ANGAN